MIATSNSSGQSALPRAAATAPELLFYILVVIDLSCVLRYALLLLLLHASLHGAVGCIGHEPLASRTVGYY